MIFLTSATDHITGLTGATLTIRVSKNGGTFSIITPVVTEIGNGWYNLALTASHTDTLGDFVLHIEAVNADPTDLIDEITSTTVTDSLTALLKYQTNRTKIDATTSTLTIYDNDKITPLHVFYLKDSTGALSTTQIVERTP